MHSMSHALDHLRVHAACEARPAPGTVLQLPDVRQPVCRDSGRPGVLVEYSVRPAQTALWALLGAEHQIVPIVHHDNSLKANLDAIIEAFRHAIRAAYRALDCCKTVDLAASSVRQRWISASSTSGRSISIARWPSETSPLSPLSDSQSPS
jgi:hypothetical protein